MVEDEYYPPKGLSNVIWGTCFGYENLDKKYNNLTIRERIKNACQVIELINKNNND